jgi:hypothetical protein
MLLVSYGEVIPMRLTQRYSADELADSCQKKRRRFEALVQGQLPEHVFLQHADGGLEYVPEHRIASTCEAVARYHDRLRDDALF